MANGSQSGHEVEETVLKAILLENLSTTARSLIQFAHRAATELRPNTKLTCINGSDPALLGLLSTIFTTYSSASESDTAILRRLAQSQAQVTLSQCQGLIDKLDPLLDDSNTLVSDKCAVETILSCTHGIRQLWQLFELTNFFDCPELLIGFMQWLQSDSNVEFVMSSLQEVMALHQSSEEGSPAAQREQQSISAYEKSIEEVSCMKLSKTLTYLAQYGNFELIWSVIVHHPSVLKILVDHEAPQRDAKVDSYFSGLETIQELLSSYPDYAANVSPAVFKHWQRRVVDFVSSKPAVLSALPFLNDMMVVLTGNESVLLSWSSSWQTFLHSSLLYMYACPTLLSRGDLADIVRKTHTAFSQLSRSEADVRLCGLIVDALGGKMDSLVGAMKGLDSSIATASSSAIDLQPHKSLLSWSNAALLSFLISCQSHQPVQATDRYPSPATGCEVLLLDLCELLDQFGASLHVLSAFLSQCLVNGRSLAQQLLSKWPIDSDNTLTDVAKRLRDFGLEEAAQGLYLARGHFWLSQSNLKQRVLEGTVQQAACNFPAAKALLYYERSGEKYRVQEVLELSFLRCAHAVRSCDALFPGLTVNVIRPLPFLADNSNFNQSIIVSPDLDSSYKQSQELLYALQEAEYLLASVHTDRFRAMPEYQALSRYIRAILLQLESTSWKESMQAVKLIASIVLENLLPVRHWLHLLDLSAWFASYHETLLGQGTEDCPMAFLTRSQVYGLLSGLAQINCHFQAQRYWNGCEADSVDGIRQVLLAALSNAILQENYNCGRAKLHEEKAQFEKELEKHRNVCCGGRDRDEVRLATMLSGGMMDLI